MGGFIVFLWVPPHKKEPRKFLSLFLLLFSVSRRKCWAAFSPWVFDAAYVACAGILWGRVTG